MLLTLPEMSLGVLAVVQEAAAQLALTSAAMRRKTDQVAASVSSTKEKMRNWRKHELQDEHLKKKIAKPLRIVVINGILKLLVEL